VTYPCPHCHANADLTTGCPGCGRAPDPDAASVVRLDSEIAVLTPRVTAARDALTALEAQLRDLWQQRNAAAARVRQSLIPAGSPVPGRPPVLGGPPASGVPLVAPGAPLASRAPRSKEASTRLVQNALFLLGGLLLAVAAIVFTAVAWSQFGVQGRALLLGGFTVAALAVPPLALRRGLTATAETFAAVGLLMVLLDGYAAWYVNLFGVATYAPLGYAGAVCAVTAAVAAGYEHVTGLTAPRLAALVAAQPVLPLLVAPLHPAATGWSFTFAAVAAMDLAVVHLRPKVVTPLGISAYVFGLFSLVAAGATALFAVLAAERPGPAAAGGAALTVAAVIPVAGAVLARSALFQSIFGGTLVVALAIAGARLAEVAGGSAAPVLTAGIAALLAMIVAATAGTLPPAVRRGPWVGALVVLAGPALGAAVSALDSTVVPGFRAAVAVPSGDWRLMGTLALLTLGATVSLRRTGVALTGAALLALAAPASLGLAWWSAPALGLVVAALALAAALRAASRGALLWPAGIATVMVLHAVGVGLGRPGVAAAVLAAIVPLGAGTAAAARSALLLARHSRVIAADILFRRRMLGGVALMAGLLAVPAAIWNAAAAASVSTAGQARLSLAAVALVVGALHAVAWRWADYRSFAFAAALLSVVSTPAWATTAGDPAAVYTGVGLVLVAAIVGVLRPAALGSAALGSAALGSAALGSAALGSALRKPAALAAAGMTASVLGLALVAAAGRSLLSVLVLPLGWWSRAGAGHPAGAGLDPFGTGHVATADVVAMGLLAVAAGLTGWLLRGRRIAAWAAIPALAVALPMALAAAGVPWPAVPGASLLVGLTGLVALAVRPQPTSGTGGFGAAGAGTPSLAVVTAAVSAVLAAAGLSGALPTQGMTLAALGAVVIAGVVTGVAARDLAARVTGWLGSVGALLAFAFTVGQAFDLSRPMIAFVVLGAAAVALAAGTLLNSWSLPLTPAAAVSAGRQSAAAVSAGRQSAAAVSAGRRIPAPSSPERRVAASEAWAVQAAAHAGAILALLLTAGSARYAAAVCTFWGLALGVRALRPGEPAVVRHVLVVVAATAEVVAWWLLVADLRVFTLEAYTLPAAAVALLAGRLALRTRPALSSWTAYGPALAAALLPTLASVLVGADQPMRRLLLGLAAMAVVLAGAHARLQAPVVIGGTVLALVALHELILVWDLLPRWIPLAAGGLLLVGLAMTLERRRRDLARVRSALTRMS
jgi:hypothetical protein